MGTNFLGPFLLTMLLLPAMKRAVCMQQPHLQHLLL